MPNTTDPFRKVSRGDQFSPHHRAWNAMIDAAKANQQKALNQTVPPSQPTVRQVATVKVVNTTDTTVPKFGAMGIADLTFKPGENMLEFSATVVLNGEECTAENSTGQFVVMLEDTPPGIIGTAAIAGVTLCRINSNGIGDTTADAGTGPVLEGAGAAGSAQILWRETFETTGEMWALIRIGNNQGPGTLPYSLDVEHDTALILHNPEALDFQAKLVASAAPLSLTADVYHDVLDEDALSIGLLFADAPTAGVTPVTGGVTLTLSGGMLADYEDTTGHRGVAAAPDLSLSWDITFPEDAGPADVYYQGPLDVAPLLVQADADPLNFLLKIVATADGFGGVNIVHAFMADFELDLMGNLPVADVSSGALAALSITSTGALRISGVSNEMYGEVEGWGHVASAGDATPWSSEVELPDWSVAVLDEGTPVTDHVTTLDFIDFIDATLGTGLVTIGHADPNPSPSAGWLHYLTDNIDLDVVDVSGTPTLRLSAEAHYLGNPTDAKGHVVLDATPTSVGPLDVSLTTLDVVTDVAAAWNDTSKKFVLTMTRQTITVFAKTAIADDTADLQFYDCVES